MPQIGMRMLYFSLRVLLPQHVAGLGVKAEQVAHGAERIGAALVDGHRRARSGLVADAAVGASDRRASRRGLPVLQSKQ